MLFHLFEHPSQPRLVLDSEHWPSAPLLQRVEARCWLEAKQQLGFPLTPSQESQLERNLKC